MVSPERKDAGIMGADYRVVIWILQMLRYGSSERPARAKDPDNIGQFQTMRIQYYLCSILCKPETPNAIISRVASTADVFHVKYIMLVQGVGYTVSVTCNNRELNRVNISPSQPVKSSTQKFTWLP